MARKPAAPAAADQTLPTLGSSIEAMLLAALARGGDTLETGRYIITYKSEAAGAALGALRSAGLRTVDARDFENQSVNMQDMGDADALMLPEIGVCVISGAAAQQREFATRSFEIAEADNMIAAIEPEYFVFRTADPSEYLRGFVRAAQAIAADLGHAAGNSDNQNHIDAQVLGVTPGLMLHRVPTSPRSGAGIRVAVLDTGMDLGHPDFVGRGFVTQSFVGEPVQDMNSHGTHCIGTACGPRAPGGQRPRYGIGWQALIYAGKVLSNAGSGSSASVLAGMNWAIANACAVISMSLGSQSPVQAAYTAAGKAALAKGCLIIAAAGNEASTTGAPANSPTILSVASLDRTLVPSDFSNFGKVDIAGIGRDVYSSVPRPVINGIKSGTSMATPHVAGCAAMWAQTSPALRGQALWDQLRQSARPLNMPVARIGAGLAQAPQF